MGVMVQVWLVWLMTCWNKPLKIIEQQLRLIENSFSSVQCYVFLYIVYKYTSTILMFKSTLLSSQEFKDKSTKQKDFVFLLNSCCRIWDLRNGVKCLSTCTVLQGKGSSSLWKQYELGRVSRWLMPFSRMRFVLSVLKAHICHCWVNQRNT